MVKWVNMAEADVVDTDLCFAIARFGKLAVST